MLPPLIRLRLFPAFSEKWPLVHLVRRLLDDAGREIKDFVGNVLCCTGSETWATLHHLPRSIALLAADWISFWPIARPRTAQRAAG